MCRQVKDVLRTIGEIGIGLHVKYDHVLFRAITVLLCRRPSLFLEGIQGGSVTVKLILKWFRR